MPKYKTKTKKIPRLTSVEEAMEVVSEYSPEFKEFLKTVKPWNGRMPGGWR